MIMKLRHLAVAAGAMTAATPAFACASCGCSLTADWLSQGLVTQPGTTVSLRYDYIPQTRLMSGTHSVNRGAITFPNDREIERYTDNHYLTASIDHQFASDWGLNLQIPFIARPHSTIAEDTDAPSHSRTNGLSDIKVTARWQGLSTPGGITGLQLGLVLPTGAIHQRFRSGPVRGEEVDRGLQPGTGTVQLMFGAYRFGKLAKNFDYILQAQGQVALDNRNDFRPGAVGNFSAGIHYTRWRGITPQLQLNFRVTARDKGANSDRPNSGGEELYLAPGLNAKLTSKLSAFAFVQVPLYQRVNGFQLVPRVSGTIGLQMHL
jgi:hypothetical protein